MSVGDRVKVRTATGDERLLRVAQVSQGVVYVATENEYQAARREGREIEPSLGFPSEDVRLA